MAFLFLLAQMQCTYTTSKNGTDQNSNCVGCLIFKHDMTSPSMFMCLWKIWVDMYIIGTSTVKWFCGNLCWPTLRHTVSFEWLVALSLRVPSVHILQSNHLQQLIQRIQWGFQSTPLWAGTWRLIFWVFSPLLNTILLKFLKWVTWNWACYAV